MATFHGDVDLSEVTEALERVERTIGELVTSQARLENSVSELGETAARIERKIDSTDPNPNPNPDPDPDPDVTVSASVVSEHQIRIDWTTSRTDIIRWRVGRDGVDAKSVGPWATDKAAGDRFHVFNDLVRDRDYRFTVTPHATSGPLESVSVVHRIGDPDPNPNPDPPEIEMVTVSGREFMRGDRRFVWLGDTAWDLFVRLTREEAIEYLDTRKSQGFNLIQAAAIRKGAGNRYGEYPHNGNVSSINPEYFDHVDFVVNAAAERGLVMGILPCWAWEQTGSVITAGNARGYGRFLGTRYRDVANIVWIFGGDAPATGQEAIWRELAAGLTEAGDRHVRTYHPQGDQTSVQWFDGDATLDFHMLQGGHCKRYDIRHALLARTHGNSGSKPWLDGEPIYEDHPICWKASQNGYSTPIDCRRDAYWALLAGAAGHTYGHHVVWCFSTGDHPFGPEAGAPGHWRDMLKDTAATQMIYARQLIESRPRVEPVAATGTGENRIYIARADDGSTVMAYSPGGQTLTVDLDPISGDTAQPWWYDPRAGTATKLDHIPASGSQSFSPPSSEDWVLVVDSAAAGFPAPGVVSDEEPGPEPEPEPEPEGDTAAERFGWGTPHPISDEFDYTGPPDPEKWRNAPESGMPGHNGNGRRIAYCTTVDNGLMVLHGYPNGDTGWVRQKLPTRYGRWEIRSRSRNIGSSGHLYHVLHLIWPTSERWPQDGEYDWVEYFDPDTSTLSAFLHYPHPNLPVQQEYAEKPGVDMTQWHNLGFEWAPTHLKGFVDGEEWFHFAGGAGPAGRRDIQDMPEGYLTIQLDNFHGAGMREAVFEIDWVRFYTL